MDYGKFKYEADMKAREARRNQANTVLKEIRFRLKIDAHDYETKKGHVVRFLEGGDKVKVMIMFRGREQSRPDAGVRLLTKLAEEVAHLGSVESMPKQDGRNMTMVIGPVKKKADAKAEQRRKAKEVNDARMTKSEARRASAEKAAQPVAEAPAPTVEEPVAEAAVKPVEAAPAPEAPAKPKAVAKAPAAPKPAAKKPAAAKPKAAPKPVAAKASAEEKPVAKKAPAAKPAAKKAETT